MTLSVVIVTYHSLPRVLECLESLYQGATQESFEVVVIDNGSTDGTVEHIESRFPQTRVVKTGENLGFGQGCNRGAQLAQGEWLVLLNPDVRLDRGALDQLLQVCRSKPRPGLVSARLRWPDGRFMGVCRKFPTVTNLLFSRGSFLSGLVGSKAFQERAMYTLPDSTETITVPAVSGTCVMVNRELFLSLGGFDKRFFMYMEDTDLSLRLVDAGCQNYFVPSAGCMHYWKEGSNAGRLRRNYLHHVSLWKYFLKHMPNGFSVLVLPILLAFNFALTAILPDAKHEQ